MKAKKDELTKLIQDMSVKLYQQAQQAQQASGAQGDTSANNSTNDDNTVDGDFKEVDPNENK